MRYVLVLCCLFITASAFADVKIVQRVKTDGVMGQKAENSTINIYIKGGKARVENPNSGQYQILDVAAGKMFMVDPSKKQVMVITSEQMKQATGLVSQLMGGKNAAPPSVQKLGTSKTYNGFKCDEYKVAMSMPLPSTGVYCVSTEINLDKEFQPLMNFSPELSQMLGGDAMKSIRGYPVHSESTMTVLGQSSKSSTDLVSYNRDDQPDSLFVVPSDYAVKAAPVPNLNQ